jgi:hypothetical protein
MTLKAYRESDGTEVQRGDTVTSFRGEDTTFWAATRAPDGHRTGKVQTGGPNGSESYMTCYDLVVREICAVCQAPLDRTGISGRADEFVHLDDGHEDHVPVRTGR